MNEIWKPLPIQGLEKSYQVSNLGHIKRLGSWIEDRGYRYLKPHLLKGSTNDNDYLIVRLRNYKKKINIRKFVHRLVAKAFIPNPHHYDQINHKDENPLNNKVSNLEWCNSKYNNNYKNRLIRVGLHENDRHPTELIKDNKRLLFPSGKTACKYIYKKYHLGSGYIPTMLSNLYNTHYKRDQHTAYGYHVKFFPLKDEEKLNLIPQYTFDNYAIERKELTKN